LQVTETELFLPFSLKHSLPRGNPLQPGEEKTPEQEVTRDLLALIASFSGRLYGMRSHKQQALVACAKQVIAEQEE